MTAILFLAALPALLCGCENFMNDNSFKENIEDAVWVATAPEFQIRIQPEENTGSTNPIGDVTIKQEVPFHIFFTPDKEYCFIRWAAYRLDNPETALGEDLVKFDIPEAPETNVTILTSDSHIIIQPVTVKRPSVMRKAPAADTADIFINTSVEVTFSKIISTDSFKYDDGTFWEEGRLKNISITAAHSPSGADLMDIGGIFEDPVINDQSLVLRPKNGEWFPKGAYIYITLEKGIFNVHENDLRVTMADSVTWSFTTGVTVDDEAPWPRDIGIGTSMNDGNPQRITDPLTPDTADSIKPRRFNSDLIYLAVFPNDRMDGDNIGRIAARIREKYDRYGNPVDTPKESSAVDRLFGNTQGGLPDALRPSQTARIDVVDFDISGFGDGVLEFELTLTDKIGNASPTYTYAVVKDTSPPELVNPLDKVTVSGADSYNAGDVTWFGAKSGEVNVNFTNSEALADSGENDFDDDDGSSQTYSDTIKWNFSVDKNAFEEARWAEVADAASPFALPVNFNTTGTYPIYAKFRDDLGNTSEAFNVGNLYIDTQPPGTLNIKRSPVAGQPDQYAFTVSAEDKTGGGASGSGVKAYEIIIQGPMDADIPNTLTGKSGTGASCVWDSGLRQLKVTKTGAGEFDFTLTLGQYTFNDDGTFNPSHPPRSGNYSVSVKMTDNVGNETAPAAYPFFHDSRNPVFQAIANAFGSGPGPYTVINGDSDTGDIAYSREDGAGPTAVRRFFINEKSGRNFRIRVQPHDTYPDTGGAGVKTVLFLSRLYDSVSTVIAGELVRTAFDGPDGSTVDLRRGNNALKLDEGNEKYALNLAVKDGNNNFSFYPFSPAAPFAIPQEMLSDTTGVFGILDNPGYDPFFGGSGFEVYYDETGPMLVYEQPNAKHTFTETGRPQWQPDFRGVLQSALPGERVNDTGGGALDVKEHATFVRGDPAFSFKVADQNAASSVVNSGLDQWAYYYDGSNGGEISFSPGNGVFWRDFGSDGTIDLSLTDFPVVDDMAAFTGGQFKRIHIVFKDKAGNISHIGVKSRVDNSDAAYSYLHHPEPGRTGNYLTYFLLDNTAPSCGGLEIRNDAAFIANGHFNNTEDALFIKDDGATGHANFSLRLTDVKEFASGIKKIHLWSAAAKLNFYGKALKINGTSYTLKEAVRGGGTGHLIITLPAALRLNGNLTIEKDSSGTGLAIDDSERWDGNTLQGIKVILEDAAGNRTGQSGHTRSDTEYRWDDAAVKTSNALTLDRKPWRDDGGDNHLINPLLYAYQAKPLTSKNKGDPAGFTISGDVIYSLYFREYGSGLKTISFEPEKSFADVTKVEYIYDYANHAGSTVTLTKAGGHFTYDGNTIAFTGTGAGGYPRTKRDNKENPMGSGNLSSPPTGGTAPNMMIHGSIPVSSQGEKSIKPSIWSDRAGFAHSPGDLAGPGDAERTITYGSKQPVISGFISKEAGESAGAPPSAPPTRSIAASSGAGTGGAYPAYTGSSGGGSRPVRAAEVFNSRNTRTPGPAPAAERRTVSYRLNSAPAAGFGAGTLPSAGDVRRDRAASPVEAIRLTASASPGRAGPVPIDRNRADKAIPVPAPAEGRGDGIPGANENGVESPAGPPEPAPEYSHTPVPGFTAGGQAAGPPDSEAPGHPETPENGGRKAGSFLINPGLKPWIFSRNGKVRRRRRRDS